MRRSSRARTTQPPTNGTTNSDSNSSTSSVKDEIVQRAMARHDSQTKSSTPRSASPSENTTRERPEHDLRRTRQQKREEGHDAPHAAADDEEADEDEVTRCICRKAEYPGPPMPLDDGTRHSRSREQTNPSDAPPENAGDLFIQCDICQVWQHGGCVGIMTNEAAPNNYYCEQCRPEEHKLMIGARGQRYSRYLPVVGPGNEPATSKSHNRRLSDVKKEEKRPGRAAELQAASQLGKRRSTMNSRVAWEEEQNLLRAIEESRGGDGTTRRTKRSNEDTEENQETKRRKTESDSASPPQNDDPEVDSGDELDDGQLRATGSSRKARNAAAQAQRENEIRRREKEREREKAEAASKRRERAGRRRAEDSPSPPPSQPIAASSDAALKNSTQKSGTRRTVPPSRGNSSSNVTAQSPSGSKKAVRPSTRKGRSGRLGRERDSEKPGSPGTNSDDGSAGLDSQILGNGSKPAKPKSFSIRTTMNEMRKRAAAISEFITRTQVEMAGTKTPPGDSTPPPATNSAGPSFTKPGISRTATGSSTNGMSKLSHEVQGRDEHEDEEEVVIENMDTPQQAGIVETTTIKDEEVVDESAFKDLSTLKMMDVLSRKIIAFQQKHGKYGER